MVGVQTHEVRVELKGMEPAAEVELRSECCGMSGRWLSVGWERGAHLHREARSVTLHGG